MKEFAPTAAQLGILLFAAPAYVSMIATWIRKPLSTYAERTLLSCAAGGEATILLSAGILSTSDLSLLFGTAGLIMTALSEISWTLRNAHRR